jgi:hypothetical protein
MRFAVIALSAIALIALLTTGARFNGACKSDRSLWWCAPARTHVSDHQLKTIPPQRHEM